MNQHLPLPARLSGAVWGHLVGDALGVPYEFRTAAQITSVEWGASGTHLQPPGTWSDDGALMLALLDSLLSEGFDPDDQGRRALAWYRHGAYAPGGKVFDVGNATRQALANLEAGVPAIDAGAGEERLGNGSLMRILPLALVERDPSDERLVEHAHLASRVTHRDLRCQAACALYSLVIRRLLGGDGDQPSALAGALARLGAIYAQRGMEAHRSALEEIEAWQGRAGRGHVIDSWWSAWDAFAGADSYTAAITRAVRYGQDTDTTAAITGGLAGTYWGIDAIPQEWLGGLRDLHLVRPIVDRLVGTDVPKGSHIPWRTSTASPLRVDQLELSGVPGFDGTWGSVGITFLPGKQRDGLTGPHWRDLRADIEHLRGLGIDTLLLLVEDSELVSCRVTALPAVIADYAIELIRFPIPDPHTPADPAAFHRTVSALLAQVRAGKHIAIACRGGLDRSGMTAACLLREAGLDADTAITRVHVARNRSLTRDEQLSFVRAWPPSG